MKILISVDIEGVAGVTGRECLPGHADYDIARDLMTDEANAAIRGAIAGGATDVTVADSHAAMRNMPPGRLDPRARLISGSPRPMTMAAGLDPECRGLVLIGWHAAAGEPGVLAHTYSGKAFARIEIAGNPVSEATLFAGYAAEIGVPLLAVSGDDRCVAEIAQQFPATRRVEVKRALSAAAADSLSPRAACTLIEQKVAEAVADAPSRAPESPGAAPLEIAWTMAHPLLADAGTLVPGIDRDGGVTLRATAQSYAEAARLTQLLALVAAAVL